MAVWYPLVCLWPPTVFLCLGCIPIHVHVLVDAYSGLVPVARVFYVACTHHICIPHDSQTSCAFPLGHIRRRRRLVDCASSSSSLGRLCVIVLPSLSLAQLWCSSVVLCIVHTAVSILSHDVVVATSSPMYVSIRLCVLSCRLFRSSPSSFAIRHRHPLFSFLLQLPF